MSTLLTVSHVTTTNPSLLICQQAWRLIFLTALIFRSGRTEAVTTVSDRSTPATSNRCEHASRTEDSTPLDSRGLRRIKKLFRPKKDEESDEETQGVGHALNALGLSETTSLISMLNDVCLAQKCDFLPDPVQDWNLLPFQQNRECTVREREKLAILEVFLCCCSALEAATTLSCSITKSVIADLMRSVQKENLNERQT